MDQNNNNPKNILNALPDLLIKFLPIIIAVCVALAAISFLFYFVSGVISFLGGAGFRVIINGFANGISACASHIVFATILAVLKKIMEK